MIAGTGRAGTSFLVRFLETCGIETGSNEDWYDRARAGLENYLLDESAPYLVKDPSLFTYCEAIDLQAIAIDALIVPMRDLSAAAESRLLQERISLSDTHQWRDRPPKDVRDSVPGGIIFSLHPIDQERLLAVGFYRLIHWAVSNGISLFLLDFPRAVEDGPYLIETLWPWLGLHCSREQADAAFEVTADPDAIRVRSTSSQLLPNNPDSTSNDGDSNRLDRDAMVILLNERDAQLVDTRTLLAEVSARLSDTETELTSKAERIYDVEMALTASTEAVSQTEALLIEHEVRLDRALTELASIHRSSLWRIIRTRRKMASKLRTTPER